MGGSGFARSVFCVPHTLHCPLVATPTLPVGTTPCSLRFLGELSPWVPNPLLAMRRQPSTQTWPIRAPRAPGHRDWLRGGQATEVGSVGNPWEFYHMGNGRDDLFSGPALPGAWAPRLADTSGSQVVVTTALGHLPPPRPPARPAVALCSVYATVISAAPSATAGRGQSGLRTECCIYLSNFRHGPWILGPLRAGRCLADSGVLHTNLPAAPTALPAWGA